MSEERPDINELVNSLKQLNNAGGNSGIYFIIKGIYLLGLFSGVLLGIIMSDKPAMSSAFSIIIWFLGMFALLKLPLPRSRITELLFLVFVWQSLQYDYVVILKSSVSNYIM